MSSRHESNMGAGDGFQLCSDGAVTPQVQCSELLGNEHF
jgi:hypothetical protein